MDTSPSAGPSTVTSHLSLTTLVNAAGSSSQSINDKELKEELKEHQASIEEEPTNLEPRQLPRYTTPSRVNRPDPSPTPLEPTNQDIAPVDLPAPLRQLDDQHAFQELARHLSVGPAPDGGAEAWLVIVGAWCVLFVQFGMLTTFGQFQTYYEGHQLAAYPPSTISWIGSISLFLTFFPSIFTGRAFDNYGARGLVIGGTSTAVAALIGLAFCKEFYQFLLAHALFGFAGGVLYTPCTAVVAHWFLDKRSTAIGLILCGSGLGGVIFPIMLSRLFISQGFKVAVLICAGMSAVLFLPSWFTIKSRHPRKAPPPWSHLKEPWKESRYAVYVIGVAMIWMNFFTPFNFANDFSLLQGLPESLATYSVGILNSGSFFGRALSGPLAGYFGAIEVFVFSGISSAVVLLVFWSNTAVGTPGTIIGLFLYGLFSGVVIALVAACCAQLSPVREFGMRLGMLWTTASLPMLAGPQIAGVIFHKAGNFTGASIFCGVTLITGATLSFSPVFYSRAVESRKQRRIRKEVALEAGQVEKQ